jgi:hypothetical protein
MSDENVFGLHNRENEANPLFADPTPSELARAEGEGMIVPEVPEEVVPEVEQEAPSEPEVADLGAGGDETPVAPDLAASQEPPVTEGETEADTVEELIFGKYKDLDAAQQGYDNLRDLQRRTAERSNAMERENAFLVERARELEKTVQGAIPLIQKLQQGQTEVDASGYPFPGQTTPPPMTPEVVDLVVAQRLDAERQAWREQETASQQEAARKANVISFMEKHDIVEHDEVDQAVVSAVQTLNAAFSKTDTEVDLADPDTLEIALEATKNPNLLKILTMRPEYFDTEEGLQLARLEAAMLSGSPITQQTRTVPASQVGQRAQNLPVTESASIGGAPPAATPDDEWSRTKQVHAAATGKGSGSPFFE